MAVKKNQTGRAVTRPRAGKMSGEKRRRQIVDVAFKLFAEKGFRGTTTREIAQKAGLSEAAIFKYFTRKEDLYKAIIDACCSDPSGSLLLEKRLAGKAGRAAFREMALFFIERYAVDPSFMRLIMFGALERNKFSDMFLASRGMETLGAVTGRIEELIKEGRFRDCDVELASRAYLGMILHYCMAQEVFGFKRRFSRLPGAVADAFVDVFFTGLEKDKKQ